MSHKLLLADDSVTIQKVIELTFADEDVKVTAVGNGQLAIDHIKADRPDIVLADVGMPERDGYEVAAYIKDTPEFAHIPVLLLTGAFEPVDEERARSVRCDGVLAKPFEPQLLISRVKELLRGDVGEQTVRLQRPVVLPPPPAPADDDDTGPVPALSLEVEELQINPGTLSESPSATPAAEVSLDDYFDRLDAAFASLSGGHSQRESTLADQDHSSWAPAPPSPSANWAAPRPAPLPPLAAEPSRPVEPPAPAPRSVPAVTLTVSDAFDTLFEAEQQVPAEHADAASPAVVALPASVVTEPLVDLVARRVVEQLGTEALRGMVTDLVSTIAERMVREEIERLKAKA
jgi:CheY-like chemotaxis protein